MDPTTAGLTLLWAALGVLANAMSPNSTWLPWSLSGAWRTAIAAIVMALIAGCNMALTGEPVGQSFLVAIVTSSANWMVLLSQALATMQSSTARSERIKKLEERMIDEAKAAERVKIEAYERGVVGNTDPPPPAAGLLILLALGGMLNHGCAGTLEGARPRLTSIAGVSLKLAEPTSQECRDLSQSEHLWLGTSLATGMLGAAGTAGGIVVLLQQDNEAKAAVYAALIAGGLLDAAAIFARTIADGYKTDWVALGCGKPAA